MRILSVDFGEKRIGLAVSDERGEIVVPVGVVFRKSDAQAASEVTAAARVRNFARRLAEASGLPVELHGEALTSSSAEGELRDAGYSHARLRAALDAEAAASILRDFLSSRPGGSPE